MGINIKYYIISIASIFISLGIGIFIGFNMNGQELYLEQQQALVDSLENKFNELRKENDNLKQRVEDLNLEKEKQSVFIENIFYEVIHNKLLGLDVAIIETNNNYFYEDVEKTLNLSGANVPLRISYNNKIYTVTEEQLKEINEIIGTELKEGKDFISLINREVANFFSSKAISERLQFLIDHQYIKYNFNEENIDQFDINHIIIAGGSTEKQQNKTDQLDVDLISKLEEQDLKIVGVERLDVEVSFIPDLKELNISTVDNVNTQVGKISLVYVLRGAEGHYGEKDSAEVLAPFVITDPS